MSVPLFSDGNAYRKRQVKSNSACRIVIQATWDSSYSTGNRAAPGVNSATARTAASWLFQEYRVGCQRLETKVHCSANRTSSMNCCGWNCDGLPRTEP